MAKGVFDYPGKGEIYCKKYRLLKNTASILMIWCVPSVLLSAQVPLHARATPFLGQRRAAPTVRGTAPALACVPLAPTVRSTACLLTRVGLFSHRHSPFEVPVFTVQGTVPLPCNSAVFLVLICLPCLCCMGFSYSATERPHTIVIGDLNGCAEQAKSRAYTDASAAKLKAQRAAALGFDPAPFDYYSDFSAWDTFRALHPLLTLLAPARSGVSQPPLSVCCSAGQGPSHTKRVAVNSSFHTCLTSCNIVSHRVARCHILTHLDTS